MAIPVIAARIGRGLGVAACVLLATARPGAAGAHASHARVIAQSATAAPCAEPPASAPSPSASSPSIDPAGMPQREISTTQPGTQAAFDRGLLMLEAFNVGQARDDFRAAEACDPHAVMLYVGEATADTIDINRPSTPEGERRAADAVARGRRALDANTPRDERALLEATALRYDAQRTQTQRFTDYADALQAYTRTYPDDALGYELAAFARWNATGALTANGPATMTADAQAIADDLAAAQRLASGDPGVHHLLIHLWEQTGSPARALPDARALDALALPPGTSHLAHMPGHIYDRLGMYDAMIAANERALADDRVYDKLGDGDGQRYMRDYHEHDLDFVLYGLTTVGRDGEARAAAAESLDAREHVAVRTHDDAQVLTLLGDAVTPLRVVAEARLGRIDAAEHDLAGLTGTAPRQHDVAQAVLDRVRHDDAAAVVIYRRVIASLGDDLGDPKVAWWLPPGEGLGAALLDAHRYAEAEQAFSASLARYPDDPHLEFGLAQAQAAQGHDDTAARRAYLAHWHGERPLSVNDLG